MTDMKIQLNGDPYEADHALTIAALVSQLSLGEKRFAVEVNEQIVPRSQHQQQQLQNGDVVEIVVAIGGG